MTMAPPHDRRVLTPAVAADIAAAHFLADRIARNAIDLRDTLAKVWGEAEDLRRLDQLGRIKDLLASATAAVDEGIQMSRMTGAEKFAWYKAKRRERGLTG